MAEIKFELEGKKCSFKLITTKDALEIQHLATRAAQGKEREGDDEKLDSLALKYLEITHNGVKNDGFTIERIGTVFSNPFAMVEISKQFQEYVGNFLRALPSFQEQSKA